MLDTEIRKQTWQAALGNLAGHSGIGLWVHQGKATLPAVGSTGYAMDFLCTGALFCPIIYLIYHHWFRARARAGEISAAERGATTRYPAATSSLQSRLLWLCFLGTASIAIPLAFATALAGPLAVTPLFACLLKGLWAALAAILIVPRAIQQGVTAAP